MRFMLFGGLVTSVYIGLAYARRFSAGCDGACPAEGLELVFVVSLEVLVAVFIVSLATALVRSPRPTTPRLEGISGRPVQEQNSGSRVVDEAYFA